jgi:hypothetical protein
MGHTLPCAPKGQYIHFHNPVSFKWMVTEGMLPFILCAGYFYAFPVRETISIEKQVPPVSYSPSGDSQVRDECPDGQSGASVDLPFY